MEQPTKLNNVILRLRHWLLVLISPFIIGIITNLIIVWGTQQIIKKWLLWTSISLALCWVILYLAAFEKAFHRSLEWINSFIRSKRFDAPRILIMDGTLTQRQSANVPLYFTDRRPDDWNRSLTKDNPRCNVDLGPINRLDDNRYDIVLNPFGETFPEDDLTLHTTLGKITDWVFQGGVYVNVAGYPFFWQHNPITKVTTQSGRWQIDVNENSQLITANLKPILSDSLLGISPDMQLEPTIIDTKQEDQDRNRFGEIAGAGGSNEVKIFRPYPITSTQSMIPILRTIDNKYIVIGAVPYGAGFFIFCGVMIDKDSKAFEKVLAAIKGWSQYEARSRKG
jgi:hypothetical protein